MRCGALSERARRAGPISDAGANRQWPHKRCREGGAVAAAASLAARVRAIIIAESTAVLFGIYQHRAERACATSRADGRAARAWLSRG